MFKKRRDRESHKVFERLISYNRKNNEVFSDLINQIISPSEKSKARRDAAMQRQRIREEMVEDAIRMAADAEKRATEAKERAERNLEVAKNVSYISYKFEFYVILINLLLFLETFPIPGAKS